MNFNQTCNFTRQPIQIQAALSLINSSGVISWIKCTVKAENTTCSLTAWERRRWRQTWETPAGTILLPETTEVPCLPSLRRFNKHDIHMESGQEHNQARLCKTGQMHRKDTAPLHPPGAVRNSQSSDSRLCRALTAPHPNTFPDLTTQWPGQSRQWPEGEEETGDFYQRRRSSMATAGGWWCYLPTGCSPSEIKSWLTCRN